MREIPELFAQLLPVLAFIPLGWLIKTRTPMKTGWIDSGLVNVLLPLMIFYHLQQADDTKLLVYPLITFALSASMNLPGFIARKTFAAKANPWLLSAAFAYFNILQFGLPVAKALFDEQLVTALVCLYLGSAVYGNTIGYYLIARTKDGNRKAIAHVFRVPFLYVLFAAIGFKLSGIELPPVAEKIMGPVGWIVSAAGMLVLGFNLDGIRLSDWKWRYLTKLNALRTVFAAAITAVLILLAGLFYDFQLRDLQLLILTPFFPVAGNLSVFAAYLKTEEKASSILILYSIAFSVVLIPMVILYFN